jgi:hypothetical protein
MWCIVIMKECAKSNGESSPWKFDFCHSTTATSSGTVLEYCMRSKMLWQAATGELHSTGTVQRWCDAHIPMMGWEPTVTTESVSNLTSLLLLRVLYKYRRKTLHSVQCITLLLCSSSLYLILNITFCSTVHPSWWHRFSLPGDITTVNPIPFCLLSLHHNSSPTELSRLWSNQLFSVPRLEVLIFEHHFCVYYIK